MSEVSVTPVEGELVLPDVPLDLDKRHACCGYTMRAQGQRGTCPTFCGAVVMLPLLRTPAADGQKCDECIRLATEHAQRCGCFKLWGPNARLPS